MSLALPETFPVTCHTDYVGPGSTFVAIKGQHDDGMHYIPLALQKGATTIVVARTALITNALYELITEYGAVLVIVDDVRAELALLSAQAAGFPTQFLKIIGVTGTKGKTTTVHLIAHILRTAGYRIALLSTTYNAIENHRFNAPLTTAQPDYLHQFFSLCVKEQVEFVVMEVAAQAITLQRIAGIQFDAVVFTNFSSEHLEFYATLDDYFAAKSSLLNYRIAQAPAFINGDDPVCKDLPHHYDHCVTFGFTKKADISAHFYGDKTRTTVRMHAYNLTVNTECMPGHFNGYNIVAASAVMLHYRISSEIIAKAIADFKAVPGRFEVYALPGQVTAIIDYAHNPASYQVILPVLRAMTHHLIVVFGAGGQRDASRRPLMGGLAAFYADLVILTTDNPRVEDPLFIIEDIKAGIPDTACHKIFIELDRTCAIKRAYSLAQPGTVIALLGKGAETYQIIGLQKIPFCEPAILKEIIAQFS